ncbi:MAG: hypothetical protein O2800_07635 [Planctomycetota bacterium]|nr:hypothetical protein [Planctomycetota bacterium]
MFDSRADLPYKSLVAVSVGMDPVRRHGCLSTMNTLATALHLNAHGPKRESTTTKNVSMSDDEETQDEPLDRGGDGDQAA